MSKKIFMEQKDYLQRQIEDFGRFLGKILSAMLRLKNSGESLITIETTFEMFKNEADFDVSKFIEIQNSAIINLLKKDERLTNEDIEKFADVLYFTAENAEDDFEKRKIIYEKCLFLYQYLDKNSHTISFDRKLKIDELKEFLE